MKKLPDQFFTPIGVCSPGMCSLCREVKEHGILFLSPNQEKIFICVDSLRYIYDNEMSKLKIPEKPKSFAKGERFTDPNSGQVFEVVKIKKQKGSAQTVRIKRIA